MPNIEPYSTFRQIENGEADVNEIPLKAKYRHCTDIFCVLYFIVIALAVIITTIMYSSHYDIEKLYSEQRITPKDSCGNICGIENRKVVGNNCFGKDYRNKNIVQYKSWKSSESECVEKCDGNFIYCNKSNLCVADDGSRSSELICKFLGKHNSNDVELWYFIFIIPICMILFWIPILYLLALYPNIFFLVFLTLGFTTLILFFAVLIFGLKTNLLALSVILVMMFVLCALFLTQRKYMHLAILLTRIVGRLFIEVPTVILFKIFSFLGFAAITAVLFGCILLTSTWIEDNKNSDAAIHLIVFQCILFVWTVLIMDGMTCFILSVVTAKWYFERDKAKIGTPICFGMYILFRYHMGSIIFGSALIVLVRILSKIAMTLKNRNTVLYELINSCLCCVQNCLEVFKKSTFVMIALHGRNFVSSGKRVFELFKNNAVKFFVVNLIICLCTCSAIIFISAVPLVIYFIITEPDSPDVSIFYGSLIYSVSFLFGCYCVNVLNDLFNTVFVCYLESSANNMSNVKSEYADLVMASKTIVGEMDTAL